MSEFKVLAADEEQEWRTTARRVAEKTKIMHEELIATGLHQDMCYKLTIQYYAQAVNADPAQPMADVRGMNKLVQKMLGFVERETGG